MVVISRPKPVFRRFRLLFARLLPEPPGHPVRRSLVCVATWHMLIINWKVIVARIYCTISNPSGHHEIRSPWGKIGPPPDKATSSLANWTWGPFPPCHPQSVHTLPGSSSSPEGAVRKRTSSQTRRERWQANTCAVSKPPPREKARALRLERFYLHCSGIWGRRETCNKAHETLFGVSASAMIRLHYAEKWFHYAASPLWSLRTVSQIATSLWCNLGL